MKFLAPALVAFVLMGAGCYAEPAAPAPAPAPQPTATTDARISVTSPTANQVVTSPLVVTGKARGSWYFEASFPAKLVDADGHVLAQAPAQAQGDWMTEDFVPFSVSLTFVKPATATGTLILSKDNPSGLPQNDASVSIPVRF
jgi:hypothetical protein